MPDYPPGTPSWVDLSSPDPDASAKFYGELFGWEAVASDDPEAGGYRSFQLDGKSVAGLMPLMNEQQPPAWATYIAVASADETAGKIKDAGGQLFMEPLDVLDVGRMAVAADTTGAIFGLWQAKTHKGAELVNKPGSLCWNELSTREPDKAKDFYPAVFGWDSDVMDTGPQPYTRWLLNGNVIAGLMVMDENFPPEVPSHWGVCFAVEDADATVSTAEGAGGTALVPPTDIPVGRFAALSDPQGVSFAIIALSAESRDAGGKQAEAIGAA